MRNLILVCLIALSTTAGALVTQQDIEGRLSTLTPVERAEFDQIADRLRCPTCTGLSILQSDAPFSLEIKNSVLDQIKTGKSSDQIQKFFMERYGYWILREPLKEGFHLLAWLLPIGISIVALFLIWLLFWRPRTRVPLQASVRSELEILGEMERALAKMTGERSNG